LTECICHNFCVSTFHRTILSIVPIFPHHLIFYICGKFHLLVQLCNSLHIDILLSLKHSQGFSIFFRKFYIECNFHINICLYELYFIVPLIFHKFNGTYFYISYMKFFYFLEVVNTVCKAHKHCKSIKFISPISSILNSYLLF